VARKLGKEAEACITQSKGVSQTSIDVRHSPSFMLGIATAPRGADHLRGATTGAMYEPTKDGGILYQDVDYGSAAKAVYDIQTLCTIADSLGLCKFATARIRMELNVASMTELFSTATGIDTDEAGMKKIADRIWTLERAFIVREGISRKDDILVGRLANDPVNGGKYDGLRLDRQKWDKMIDDYYELVGWDKETGIPTRATLESLGLKAVADELEQMGKLP